MLAWRAFQPPPDVNLSHSHSGRPPAREAAREREEYSRLVWLRMRLALDGNAVRSSQ
jgi:hypothetical protein